MKKRLQRVSPTDVQQHAGDSDDAWHLSWLNGRVGNFFTKASFKMRRDTELLVHSALFIVALAIMMLGFLWAFRYPGFESFTACLAGFAGLVAEYLWTATSHQIHALGSRPSKKKLKTVATRIGLSNIGGLSKHEMHRKLLERLETLRLQDRRHTKLKCSIVLLGIFSLPVLAVLTYRLYPSPESTPVDVEMRWFASQNGQDQLVGADDLKVDVEPRDIIKQQLPIPINLVIRNRERQTLHGVKVELRYPMWMEPRSNAIHKLALDNQINIFQHQIGDLEPSEHFTTVGSSSAADVVNVPFAFTTDTFALLTKDRLPIWMYTIVGQDIISEIKIGVSFNIITDGRKTTPGRLTITPKFGLNSFTELELSKESPITNEDVDLFQSAFAGYKEVDAWTGSYITPQASAQIGFREVECESQTVQILLVDGVRRRVTVDSNRDKNIDFSLWDEDIDGAADTKVVWDKEWPMRRWEKGWLESPLPSVVPNHSALSNQFEAKK